MKSCFGDRRIPKWMSEAFSSNFASIVFEVYAFDLWHCFKIWVIMSGHKFINYLGWTNTFPSLASFACGISNIVYNFYYTSINIYFTTIVIVYKLVISIFSVRQNKQSRIISWISIISNHRGRGKWAEGGIDAFANNCVACGSSNMTCLQLISAGLLAKRVNLVEPSRIDIDGKPLNVFHSQLRVNICKARYRKAFFDVKRPSAKQSLEKCPLPN